MECHITLLHACYECYTSPNIKNIAWYYTFNSLRPCLPFGSHASWCHLLYNITVCWPFFANWNMWGCEWFRSSSVFGNSQSFTSKILCNILQLVTFLLQSLQPCNKAGNGKMWIEYNTIIIGYYLVLYRHYFSSTTFQSFQKMHPHLHVCVLPSGSQAQSKIETSYFTHHKIIAYLFKNIFLNQ